jgi:hypothetical protein
MILILCNCNVQAQALNRQMFSSQGKSVVLKNGTFVSQSIGQQSVFGSLSNLDFTVQQGFQQSAKSKSTKIISFEAITTVFYPNPIIDNLNFKFSSEIKGMLKIAILTVAGKQVFRGEQYVFGNILTISSLGYLPSGVYVVYLAATNYKYTAKIIKN